MSQLSENIRRLRKRAGVTQEELAHIVGASTPAVSAWENGQTTPRLRKHIDALCDYFGVTEEQLFNEGVAKSQPLSALPSRFSPVVSILPALNEAGIDRLAGYAADLAGNPAYRA